MAEGPTGLENQEGAEIKAPADEKANKTQLFRKKWSFLKKTIITEVPKKFKAESKTTEGLGGDPDVVESVDRAKIEALTNEIATFCNAPRSAVEQGLKSSVFILNDVGFKRRVEAYSKELFEKNGIKQKGLLKESDDETAIIIALGETVESRNKKIIEYNQKLETTVREHANNTGGICISQKEGAVILVKKGTRLDEKEVVVHELIHAMGHRKNGTGGGFKSETGDNVNLDEAATQVLTLALKYPNLTVQELVEKIFVSKEIKNVPYRKIVAALLTAMYATSKSKNPFTFKDLASCYFYGKKGEGVNLMQVMIVGNAMENLKGQVQDWLLNDLESK